MSPAEREAIHAAATALALIFAGFVAGIALTLIYVEFFVLGIS